MFIHDSLLALASQSVRILAGEIKIPAVAKPKPEISQLVCVATAWVDFASLRRRCKLQSDVH
jgi:hypothetical protein